jgi:hypothetical protein
MSDTIKKMNAPLLQQAADLRERIGKLEKMAGISAPINGFHRGVGGIDVSKTLAAGERFGLELAARCR